MNNTKIIQCGLDFYFLTQDLFEPNEMFFARVWYILKNLNSKDNKDNFETLVKKSRIIVNKERFECDY